MNRREALTVLAVATVHWPASRAAARATAAGATAAGVADDVRVAAPERVRCGTPITLAHPDAQAFELSSPGRPTVQVAARHGRLIFRAPIAALPGFVAVTCTPLADGAPIGPSVDVPVYTPRLSWGA